MQPCSIFIFCIISFAYSIGITAAPTSEVDYSIPAEQPYVFVKNRPTAKLVNLGKLLFFDIRLSGNNKMSCATCHKPDAYWSDGLAVGIGHDGKPLSRSTPTLTNTAYNKKQFWDGRASSLEQQSIMPITAEMEMNQNLDDLVKELQNIPGYVKLFENNFLNKKITASNISRAIAAFQRTLVSNNSPFDRWYRGEKSTMSAAAINGFNIFKGKADCADCHSDFNFTDDEFHNIGLSSYSNNKDLGRYEITKNAKDRGAFKTPTLRNVAKTAPYMHDGSVNTLQEVIHLYDIGGIYNENIDKKMRKLKLTKRESTDLIEFLKSLTEEITFEVPQKLPM